MDVSITEIAAVSEESAAGVEETTAFAQLINSPMVEVTDSSVELAKLAENLHDLVGRFKISGDRSLFNECQSLTQLTVNALRVERLEEYNQLAQYIYTFAKDFGYEDDFE